MTREAFEVMRPGIPIPRLDRYDGALPVGWHWQVKIDDERGIVRRGAGGVLEMFNRHWYALPANKARAFEDAGLVLLSLFPEQELFDVGFLGFRGHWKPGSIVLFDLPREPGGWTTRWHRVTCGATTTGMPAALSAPTLALPEPWDPLREPPTGTVVHLADNRESDVRAFFASTRDRDGLEGVIGRNPAAPYQCGDSREMVKIRWK